MWSKPQHRRRVTRLYPMRKRVLEVVMLNPSYSVGDIARALGRQKSTVAFHLKSLLDGGWLDRKPGAYVAVYHPTDLARSRLGCPGGHGQVGSVSSGER